MRAYKLKHGSKTEKKIERKKQRQQQLQVLNHNWSAVGSERRRDNALRRAGSVGTNLKQTNLLLCRWN